MRHLAVIAVIVLASHATAWVLSPSFPAGG
jgi:hypothetical protein